MRLFPEQPPPGPFRREFWRSPLRGPWLASVLSAALLPLILICAVTGFMSHAAYEPDLGRNGITGDGDVNLWPWDWPTSPQWLYAATQGLHVVSGLAALPILLAKLWAVIPKLFEWPPLRSPAHALERIGLALLVGGSLFLLITGVLNIQLWYPWKFSFVPAHYYAAFVFLGALLFHVLQKLPVMLRVFRGEPVEHSSAPARPGETTVSRRLLLGTVAAGSAGMALIAGGQSVGGPFRSLGLLAPRGAGTAGFPVNKTARTAGITAEMTGAAWRLELAGPRGRRLSRDELLAMPQAVETLTLGCVEGWSTTQEWTGIRLVDLARLAGVDDPAELFVESLQPRGAFRQVTLNRGQASDPRALLALSVNGAPLSADHGFPARIIVPALPGVHNTKWVSRLEFRS